MARRKERNTNKSKWGNALYIIFTILCMAAIAVLAIVWYDPNGAKESLKEMPPFSWLYIIFEWFAKFFKKEEYLGIPKNIAIIFVAILFVIWFIWTVAKLGSSHGYKRASREYTGQGGRRSGVGSQTTVIVQTTTTSRRAKSEEKRALKKARSEAKRELIAKEKAAKKAVDESLKAEAAQKKEAKAEAKKIKKEKPAKVRKNKKQKAVEELVETVETAVVKEVNSGVRSLLDRSRRH